MTSSPGRIRYTLSSWGLRKVVFYGLRCVAGLVIPGYHHLVEYSGYVIELSSVDVLDALDISAN